MLFSLFETKISEFWQIYFEKISDYQAKGRLSGNGLLLYPNLLILIDAGEYYLAELMGASRKYNGLRNIKYKENTPYRYLTLFSYERPSICFPNFAAERNSVRGLCVMNNVDKNEVVKRFPAIESYKSSIVLDSQDGASVGFSEGFVSCSLEDVLLVSSVKGATRAKQISHMFAVSRRITPQQLAELLRTILSSDTVHGVQVCTDGNHEALFVGSGLQSLYLSQAIRETNIGTYLNKHPQVLMRALSSQLVHSELELLWVADGHKSTGTSIRPDLFVQREDGFFDIYDLKTAKTDRTNITKGRWARKRFIEYINEGISQLAHYADYFRYDDNAKYAAEKFGIVVNEPKLVLVVGSWENADKEEVDAALRAFQGSGITMLDYDTLVHQFYSSSHNVRTMKKIE